MPGGDHVDQPLAYDGGLERPAVEEQPGRADEGQIGLSGRRPLTVEEVGHVPRDLLLGGERQAPLPAARVRSAPRPGSHRHEREEAVEHGRLDLRARERRGERAADDGPAAPGHRDAHLPRRRVTQHPLLRRAARGHEPVEALRIEALTGGKKARLQRPGERDVDVVAPEEEVLADRDPLEPELPAARARADQREVRRPTAHVDDQDERHGRETRAPVALMGLEPGVEGRLRLLEEGDSGKPGRVRGGEGQLARDLVERRGHREDDLLRRERLGKARVPGFPEMGQDACRGLHR